MRFLFSLIISIFLIIPGSADAHSGDKGPFFTINQEYPKEYPVPTSSLKELLLPQDIDIEPRLINEPLQFEIDASKTSQPEKLEWDFGDGTKATGLKNAHSYTKMGSYILTIKENPSDPTQPELLQSVLINVVPDKDYPLPQSIIEVNGKQSKDPLIDIINVDFKQSINFKSLSESESPIVSYVWDFGDGNSGSNATESHRYDAQVYQYFPLLRITTADGFIADSFVEVQGSELAPLTTPAQSSNSWSRNQLVLLGGVGLILILLAGKFLLKL